MSQCLVQLAADKSGHHHKMVVVNPNEILSRDRQERPPQHCNKVRIIKASPPNESCHVKSR
eukprot:3559520-Amphidinium_carterae.3